MKSRELLAIQLLIIDLFNDIINQNKRKETNSLYKRNAPRTNQGAFLFRIRFFKLKFKCDVAYYSRTSDKFLFYIVSLVVQ
jgi:hypothetical protein